MDGNSKARYRVSYCDYGAEDNPAADKHHVMDRAEILTLMDQVLTSSGSFVSVMDSEGTMLQFVIDEDGSVLLDVPAPKKRGSYAKRTTLDACIGHIEALGDVVSLDAIGGLEFERW